MKRSLPARAGAALIALTALTAMAFAAKVELAKPDQVADAQAQIKANGLNCEVGQVRYGGEGDMKNKDKKTIHVQVYEVTCANSFGYMISGPKGGSADSAASACPALAATSKKGDANNCQLPENLDVKSKIQAQMAKAGVSCSVQDAKWIGINKSRADGFEVACAAPSPGYLVFVPQTADGQLSVSNCMMGGYKCAMTTPDQQTAWVKSLASQSGMTCDIDKSRYVGSDSKDGTSFFEVGCAKGSGFMFAVNKAGSFDHAIGCADAANLAGGCTLTDKAQIQASGAESWGAKLKTAGVPCNVTQAHLIGQMSGKRDVVEYQCSDRPAGLIVGLPNQAGQKPDVVDCFDARHFGTKCQFTSADALNGLLTKALAASGKTCAVSAFQNLGGYGNGASAFEVACGSGPGYIAVLPADYSKPSQVQSCAEAAKTANRTGISCSLPGNT